MEPSKNIGKAIKRTKCPFLPHKKQNSIYQLCIGLSDLSPSLPLSLSWEEQKATESNIKIEREIQKNI